MNAFKAFKPVIRWKLRSIMADKRMSATDLAKRLNVNRVTVSNWANSDEVPAFKKPNKVLDDICRELACTPGELILYIPDQEATND